MKLVRPLTVAITLTALTLAGCGSSADEASSKPQPSAVTGEVGGAITVWTWDGAPGTDAMTKLAAGFQAKTGVTVNSKVIKRDDFKAQAQLALNSGEHIDVLGVQPSQFAAEVQSKLLPVSSYESKLTNGLAGYKPATVEQTRKLYTGGQLYSVPFGSTGSAVCFYNGDLLAKAGAQPPQTWADVKALSDALKTKAPGVLTLVKPSGADTWFEDEFVLTMAGQKNPGFFNSVRYEKGKWDQAPYVEALARYGQLFTDGTLQRSSLDLGYTDAMNAFNTGKAALVCNGSWEAGLLKKSFRQTNGIKISSVGVVPVPSDDPASRSLRSFLDVTWGIPTTAQNQATAAAFIAYATQAEGVNLWADGLGFVPAATNWKLDASVLTGDSTAEQGYQQIQDLINKPSSDRNNLSSFSAQVGKYVLEVAQGRLSAKDAAAKAQKDLDSGLYS
ncbi:ABC transporter substrate-binding protein [Micromonospora sp. 067-2]|uniref:ABC transporter substrate-binding protein n=1 Tax=Micromonospora sp. 067-2 TaxID=2789270 RepID=UPI00397CF2C3